MKIRLRRRNPFSFTTPRQRLAILIAAAGTAAAVSLALLLPHAQFLQNRRPLPAPPAVCAPGGAVGCVGGTMEVMLLAPAPPASAPR